MSDTDENSDNTTDDESIEIFDKVDERPQYIPRKRNTLSKLNASKVDFQNVINER